MKKKFRIILIAFVLLASFYVFSKYVRAGGMGARDFAITVKVQDRITRHVGTKFDSLFEDIGFFASPIFSTVTVVGITIFLFITTKRSRKIYILVVPIAFGLLIFGEMYGKSVVHHPAPPFFMIKNPTSIFPKYYINEEYSYPSGHAARAVFIAMIASRVIYLASRKNSLYSSNEGMYQTVRPEVRSSRLFASNNKIPWVILLSLFYVALVSISRIYLGHHWASDVIGGWLLGSGLGLSTMILL